MWVDNYLFKNCVTKMRMWILRKQIVASDTMVKKTKTLTKRPLTNIKG